MKIEEIVVSIERKINLGNYENVTYFESRKITLESNDQLGDVLTHNRENLISGADQFFIRFRNYESNKDAQYKQQAEKLLEEAEKEV